MSVELPKQKGTLLVVAVLGVRVGWGQMRRGSEASKEGDEVGDKVHCQNSDNEEVLVRTGAGESLEGEDLVTAVVAGGDTDEDVLFVMHSRA